MKAKLSKLETAGWCFAIAIVLSPIAFVIAQSLPISRFPNTPTPNDSDLFVLAQTLAPATNKNIRYDQLRGAIRSGMATETYVNSVSNALVLNATDHLWTNNGTFLQPTTNGDARIIGSLSLISTGLLGGLAVTQDVRLLGHNSTSNFVWTCTNSTTGEGEWRTASGTGFAALEVQTNTVRLGLVTNLNWTYGVTGSISASTAILGIDDSLSNSNLSNALFTIITTASNTFAFNRTNQWTTNIAGTPVNGEVKFQGFPGRSFVTNNARNATHEWEPTNQSVRIGSLANVGIDSHHYIATSNYWDNPNIGLLSYAFGTNHLVNAPYSIVASGIKNLIYTNASYSTISGGTNNAIQTNAYSSTISGGEDNTIRVDSKQSVIAGGQGNIIDGGSIAAVISGGLGNQMRGGGHSYSAILSGNNNILGKTGDASGATDRAVLAGGEQNTARGNYVSLVGGQLNIMQGASDWSFIGGGISNTIGVAPSFGVNYAVLSGGSQNSIGNDGDYSVIDGGRLNSIGGSASNSWIGGGAFNSMSPFPKFAIIPGGERNSITANYGFAIGTSNEVTAVRAGSIGVTVTNSTAGSVTIGELISYNTPAVIAGAGSGNTNYLLAVTSPKMLLGSSNVNIYGVSGTIAGKTHTWSANITNLSADTWGISFASGTNRWKFQSWMYGTNAPVVLTNNTLLRLQGESEGTNTLVTYQYFSPAL